MAEELALSLMTTGRTALRRARSSKLDYSPYRDAEGRPRYPLADARTALDMLRSGFDGEDVRHVLGYLPELDANPVAPHA